LQGEWRALTETNMDNEAEKKKDVKRRRETRKKREREEEEKRDPRKKAERERVSLELAAYLNWAIDDNFLVCDELCERVRSGPHTADLAEDVAGEIEATCWDAKSVQLFKLHARRVYSGKMSAVDAIDGATCWK